MKQKKTEKRRYEMSEIRMDKLPKTLDELKAMPQAGLTNPEEVAALTVAVLALYPENPAETEKMLDFLRGPRPLNGMDKQFIKDRFRGKRISDAVLFCRHHAGE